MHKSKEDVAKLFNEKEGMPINSTPQDIAAYVRDLLRKKFTSADVGVTGGNFLNIFICRHTSTSVQEIIGTSLEVFGFILLLLGLLCFLYMAYLNLLGFFGKEEKNPSRITNFWFTKGHKNSSRRPNFLRFLFFLALGLLCGYILFSIIKSLF